MVWNLTPLLALRFDNFIQHLYSIETPKIFLNEAQCDEI